MSDRDSKAEEAAFEETTLEEGATPDAPMTRGQKFKRHCGRRWWIYLIVFIVVVLAAVLGMIFGIIPNIAQKSVNESTLHVDGIAIRNPANDRFTLDMNSTVHSHAPLSAHFSPQTFEMYLPPTNGGEIVPFMTLSVGQLNVEDVFTINVTNVDTKILNKDAYNQFSALVLGKETLDLGIRSNPELNVGAIRFKVDYQKTVQLNGLNGLKGIVLTNPETLENPLEDGTNMLTDGVIPNPSSFTLQVGDLTVDMSVNGIPLGWSVIKDLTLYPGDNKVKINNHINPALINSPLFQASLLQDNVRITLTANSTIYKGQHITWLEKPLHDAPPVNATLNPK